MSSLLDSPSSPVHSADEEWGSSASVWSSDREYWGSPGSERSLDFYTPFVPPLIDWDHFTTWTDGEPPAQGLPREVWVRILEALEVWDFRAVLRVSKWIREVSSGIVFLRYRDWPSPAFLACLRQRRSDL